MPILAESIAIHRNHEGKGEREQELQGKAEDAGSLTPVTDGNVTNAIPGLQYFRGLL